MLWQAGTRKVRLGPSPVVPRPGRAIRTLRSHRLAIQVALVSSGRPLCRLGQQLGGQGVLAASEARKPGWNLENAFCA